MDGTLRIFYSSTILADSSLTGSDADIVIDNVKNEVVNAGDVDGDGEPDLLVGRDEEHVVLFLNSTLTSSSSLDADIDADYTFVNAELAKFYGLVGQGKPAGSQKPEAWWRVDGLKARGRGGVLGMASLLSKQSGASRTSPVLRGNWVVETMLGEKLPKPPAKVPDLPDSETDTNGLTVRQLVEKHG